MRSASTTWTLTKRNIGMVFQNYAIFPHLHRAARTWSFGLKNRKCRKEEMESRTDEYLKLMQIEEYADRHAGAPLRRSAAARGAGPCTGASSRTCC